MGEEQKNNLIFIMENEGLDGARWTDGLGRMELAKYKTSKLCSASTEQRQ